jgi:DNA-directed RNA polymerase subunit RPC12/RpoP
MGDVPVKCSQCGREVLVSEFADPAALSCPDCGAKLSLAPKKPAQRGPTVFRKREEPAPKTPPLSKRERKKRRRERQKKQREPTIVRLGNWRMSHNILAWVLFLALGGILTWLRFGEVITAQGMEGFQVCGMVGIGVLYCVIIVEAFSEDTFDGILTFFAPPYTLYYLFGKSDSFYLRALLGAFLMAFGYDLFLVLQDELGTLMSDVNAWIQNADW